MPERVLMRLPQGVVLVDSELRIDHANPAAERLLGVGSPAIPYPIRGRISRSVTSRLGSFGPDPPTGGTLVETDHHFFWVEGVPAFTAETAILIVDDVTERERARQSEREFVENAAHELRTPLAAIVSVMDVLEGGAKDIPETAIASSSTSACTVSGSRGSRRRCSSSPGFRPAWSSRG
jgi:signal transduction histidine kinase